MDKVLLHVLQLQLSNRVHDICMLIHYFIVFLAVHVDELLNKSKFGKDKINTRTIWLVSLSYSNFVPVSQP